MVYLVIAAALALLVVVLILLCPFAARMDGPPRHASKVGTTNDPRVEWMVSRQRAYGKWLRKKGRTLLADCAYEPVLHQRENVVPLRSRR